MTRFSLQLASCATALFLAAACDSDGRRSLTGAEIGAPQAAPIITDISPNPARAGQRVVVRGQNFGHDPSAVTVDFGGLHGAVASVSDQRIDVDAPPSLPPGTVPVRVLMAGRPASAPAPLTIAPSAPGSGSGSADPVITSISPNPAEPGQPVVITGRNFGTDPAAVQVTFGGTPATVTSVASERIDTMVPASLPPGPTTLRVTVAGRSATASVTIAPASGEGTGGTGGTGGDGSGGEGTGGGTGGGGTGGDGSGGGGTGGDGSGGGGGTGGGGDHVPDVRGTYDVEAGVASNSCPADFSLLASTIASSDATVTQTGPTVTAAFGGGLRFTDEGITADGEFDSTVGSDRMQLDFDGNRFTGRLTRRLAGCAVVIDVEGTKR